MKHLSHLYEKPCFCVIRIHILMLIKAFKGNLFDPYCDKLISEPLLQSGLVWTGSKIERIRLVIRSVSQHIVNKVTMGVNKGLL